MWLLMGLVGWPLIEIALFVTLGGAIGLWPTLAIVVGTGLLGISILRGRGMRTFGQLRQTVTMQPRQPLGEGLVTMVAAILLVLPGFLTDALGLVLLIPPVQRFVLRRIGVELRAASVNWAASVTANRMGRPHPGAAERDDQVIEGEIQEMAQEARPTHPPSGWTRH